VPAVFGSRYTVPDQLNRVCNRTIRSVQANTGKFADLESPNAEHQDRRNTSLIQVQAVLLPLLLACHYEDQIGELNWIVLDQILVEPNQSRLPPDILAHTP
jgi:hypothetical protein